MPTEQPSNAPQADAPKPMDDRSAASVLADDQLDETPGGGGLGGARAGDPLGGSARGGGGTAPNLTMDPGVSGGGSPEREAQQQALETTPSTGGRSAGS